MITLRFITRELALQVSANLNGTEPVLEGDRWVFQVPRPTNPLEEWPM